MDVEHHIAPRQLFEAAPEKADEDLVPRYVGSHNSTPAIKPGATPTDARQLLLPVRQILRLPNLSCSGPVAWQVKFQYD